MMYNPRSRMGAEGRSRRWPTIVFALLVLAICGPLGCGKSKKKKRVSVDPAGESARDVTVAVPLTSEQAAMLQGVRAATVDVSVDDEMVGQGVRGEILSGAMGGVRAGRRAIGGEPEPVPGAPPRQELSGDRIGRQPRSPNALAFVTELTLPLALSEGVHVFVVVLILPGHPEISLLKAETSVAVSGGRIQDAPIDPIDVAMPSNNKSGLPNLVQAFAMEKAPDLGIDPTKDTRPLTEEEISRIVAALKPQLEGAAKDLAAEIQIKQNVQVALPVDAAVLSAPSIANFQCVAAGTDKCGSGVTLATTSVVFTFGCDRAAGCAFECSLDKGAFADCEATYVWQGLADGAHSFAVRPKTGGGVVGSAANAVFLVKLPAGDSGGTSTPSAENPPSVSFTETPKAATDTTASFSFACNGTCLLSCALDGGPFAACPSPITFTGLAAGNHTLSVRGTASDGKTSNPIVYTWAVVPPSTDTIPPETAISVQPSAISNKTTATFGFSCSDSSAQSSALSPQSCSFYCQLDTGTPSPCTSQLTLSAVEGSHTFSVYAVDPAGNKDPTPASFTWTVDTTPPETAIRSQPSAVSNQTSGSFTFSCPSPPAGEGSGGGCSFECSADSASYASCASPLTLSPLTAGAHTFSVRALDPAGNADGTPAGYSWTIDLTPPTVAISSQPSAVSNQVSVSFSLACSDVGAGLAPPSCSFACKLDQPGAAGSYATCSSPLALSLSKGDGSYTFTVQATDPAGNPGTTSYTWTLDTTAPSAPDPAKLTISQNNPGTNDTVSGAGGAVEASSTVKVWADALLTALLGQGTASASGVFDAISIGDNTNATVYVTATDAAGNQGGSTSKTNDWVPPSISITNVEGDTASTYYDAVNDTNTDIAISATDSAGVATCKWDTTDIAYGSMANTCASTSLCTITAAATEGTTYTRYIACIDSAGNANDAATNVAVAWTNDWTAPPLTLTSVEGDAAATYYDTANDSNTDIVFTSTDAVSGTTACRWYTTDSAYSSGTGTACASATACQLTGAAAADATYARYMACVDAAGNGSSTANNLDITWTNDWSAPTFGGLTSATAVSTTQINLSWSAATDTVSASGAIVYDICRSATSGGCSAFSATYTSTAGATSYNDTTGLSAATRYYYVVRAKDEAGNSDTNTTEKSALTWSTTGAAVAVTTHLCNHTCSLSASSEVKCWGYNSNGQLGDGTTTDRATPLTVSSLSNGVAVAGGYRHTCSLLSDGTVKCWGRNNFGQLGDGTTIDKSTPVTVSMPAGPMGVKLPRLHESTASGAPARPFREGLTAHLGNHTCSLLSDGTVKCWGINNFGQLGDGTTADKSTPVAVSSLSNGVAVTGGYYHTCSLLSDGTVKCWGINSNGQLGDGTTAPKSTPVAVSSLSGGVAVAGGYSHTCSLISDGTVKCWGRNVNGQLGDGTTADKSTPVAVSSLSGGVAVAGGYYHTCSLLSDGMVKCWGYNLYGQLGDGTAAPKSTPVAVSSLSGGVAVAGGYYHTCSLLFDGTVKCWGYNFSGQLGDGTTADKSTPVAVSTLSAAVAIAAGKSHTCSLLSDGTVKCWGRNLEGQLGDGTAASKSTPVAVSGLSGGVAVAGGEYHTCSLFSDGTVICWGNNANGQLGDGTTTNKSTPVQVQNLP